MKAFSMRIIGFMVAMSLLPSAWAAGTFVWTGGGDGTTWASADNWYRRSGSPTADYPTFKDTAILAPGEGVTLELTYGVAQNVQVSNGTVRVTAATPSTQYFNYSGSGTFFVEKGASFELTNFRLVSYNSTGDLTKTGGGVLIAYQIGSTLAKSPNQVSVSGGTLTVNGTCYGTNFVVSAGATLRQTEKRNYQNKTFITLQPGARLVSEKDPVCDLTPAGSETTLVTANGKTTVYLESETDVAGTISGGGTVSVRSSATLGQVNMARSTLVSFPNAGSKLTVTGGCLGSAATKNDKNPLSVLPQPNAAGFSGTHRTDATVEVRGGEVHLQGKNGESIVSNLVLKGGATYLHMSSGNYSPGTAFTSERPATILLDGGELLYSYKDTRYHCQPLADDEALVIKVGEGGVRVRTVESMSYDYDYTEIKRPFVAAGANDGGFTRRGIDNMQFFYPLRLTGPVSLLDGVNQLVSAARIQTTPAFFGTGDFIVGNAQVEALGLTEKAELRLASGTDSAVVYTNMAYLSVRDESASSPMAYSMARLRRAGKGSVLFLKDEGSNPFTVEGSSVKVDGGVATDAVSGLVRQPIFCLSSGGVDFATYADAGGFGKFANYSKTLSDDADAVVNIANTTTTLESGKEYAAAAMRFLGRNLTIEDKAKLTLGKGSDPALMTLLNASVLGSGTIDFGDREGVIVSMGNSNSDLGEARISCVVTGTGGLTVVSPGIGRAAGLAGANTYSGGTWINSVLLYARNASCFGSGTVTIGGGERFGGRVVFPDAITVANDFRVGGFGVRMDKYNTNEGFGALQFLADAVIAGNVELTEPTRVSAKGAGVRGTISGAISGDRLIVYNGDGTVVLTGENAYAGGTEVVSATLSVAKATGLGTGAVTLDNGTLAFCNTAPITVANDIAGIGKLRLEGNGDVTLAGDLTGLEVAGVEVTPGEHAFASDFTMRPLVSTAEKPRKAAVLVLKAGATYTLSQDDLQGYFDIVLEDGATLDLGGEELTICRFTGNRASVNGTIVETNPKLGVMLIIR